MSTFEAAIPVIMAHEGVDGMIKVKDRDGNQVEVPGWWVDDPDDPGGETVWGWSMLTIKRLKLVPRDLGLDLDAFVPGCLSGVSKAACVELYRKHFWLTYGYDRIIEQSCATKVFDAAVNMGPHEAHVLAQAAAGLKPDQQDGVLGMVSFGSINLTDPVDFIRSYTVQLSTYYRSIAVGPKAKFLPTWLKRAAWGT